MKEFARKYFNLLVGEYSTINLTRITDFNEFYDKQILDSIAPYTASEKFKEHLDKTGVMIDVGFGGGFPILPMAFLNPSKKFVGIETRGKKVKVVAEIAEKLGLNNVTLIHRRIEECIVDVEATCTLKAVGKVQDFLNKFNTREKIQVYFYKGPNFYTLEKDQIMNIQKEWLIVEEKEIEVPNTEKRFIIGFENKSVPIGAILSKSKRLNNLVKLSELI